MVELLQGVFRTAPFAVRHGLSIHIIQAQGPPLHRNLSLRNDCDEFPNGIGEQ